MAANRADALVRALVEAWTAVAVWIAIADPVLPLIDALGFIRRAAALSLRAPRLWSDGLYPLGYPLLLRAVFAVVGDYAAAGSVISILSGIAGLLAVHAIGKRVWSPTVGLLAVAICATSPLYLVLASHGSTDMPAAAALLVGIAVLCRGSDPPSSRQVFLAGSALGLAYLFRYTALLLVPVVVVWLAFRPVSVRALALRTGSFVAGFLLVASPQLAVSWLVNGNPFFNQQVINVHFGMFGQGNWGLNWANSTAAGNTGLLELVARHPEQFFRHWIGNLWLSAFGIRLLAVPLLALAVVGLAEPVVRQRWTSREMLLILVGAGYTAGVCIAFPSMRLLLPCLGLLALFAAAGLQLLGTRLPATGWGTGVKAAALAGLLAWLAVPFGRLVADPMPGEARIVAAVSEALRAQGAQAREVLSFNAGYYDLSSPLKPSYQSFAWFAPDFRPYGSVKDIADRMREDGQRYLVADRGSAIFVRGLDGLWPFPEAEMDRYFVLLDVIAPAREDVRIYRLR